MRGEGAYLVDRNGYRFMQEYHEMARACPARRREPGDRRADPQDAFHARLPRRAAPAGAGSSASASRSWPSCSTSSSIDVSKDLIPIHPAAHYMIGGVDADLIGRTSLTGLYAVGEAGCTGLHGANRLGSNSLLEGLAFGARAGADAAPRGARQDDDQVPADAGAPDPAVDRDGAGHHRRQEQPAQRDVAQRRHRAHAATG